MIFFGQHFQSFEVSLNVADALKLSKRQKDTKGGRLHHPKNLLNVLRFGLSAVSWTLALRGKLEH